MRANAPGSIAAAIVLLSVLHCHAAKRPGAVQFSNGETVEGQLSLTPGADLRLHVSGNQIRVLDFDRVREIRIAPTEEQMVQKWRFLEAGQTKKQLWGKPYLIRSLEATAFLADGEKITGHLYTTVLYVEPAEGLARKVILQAKQRGQEGQAADALAYPARISFADSTAGAEDAIRLRIVHPEVTEKTQVAALTWGALFTFEGRKTGQPGEYKLASPLGRDLILALKTGGKIVVGWPKGTDPKFAAIVQSNLGETEDFFDERKLLGVFFDQASSDVYSLHLMSRKGKTTLDAAKSQPWRLVVLRWKYDAESQRVLLAGRGHLFRGIGAGDEPLPAVELSEKLWKPKQQGGVWVAGE